MGRCVGMSVRVGMIASRATLREKELYECIENVGN